MNHLERIKGIRWSAGSEWTQKGWPKRHWGEGSEDGSLQKSSANVPRQRAFRRSVRNLTKARDTPWRDRIPPPIRSRRCGCGGQRLS